MKLSLALLLAAASNALVLPFLEQYEFELPSLFSSDTPEPSTPQIPVRVEGELAPLAHVAPANIIPHRYIVVLNHDEVLVQSVGEVAHSMASTAGARDLMSFAVGAGLSGFVVLVGEEGLASLRADPRVAYVEPDSRITVSEADIQKDAPWGLARISHRRAARDTSYTYDDQGGRGVDAYVIDTGIKVEHDEFEGRAQWAKAVAFPGLQMDTNGHGTHCAGIIGSKNYGVAKNVNLYAVGVMSPLGVGSTSDIIKGMEEVASLHAERKLGKGFKGLTVNMSLGGGALDALDQAADALVKLGVHVAVAAGNDNADACEYSPARAKNVVTVGALNVGDERALFSNWGQCVDVFAPGQDIELTYIWSPTTVMSGTLMASPHVAGLLSYYLSLVPELSSEFAVPVDPASMKARLLKYATKGALLGLDLASPNKLIYNGGGQNLTDLWNI